MMSPTKETRPTLVLQQRAWAESCESQVLILSESEGWPIGRSLTCRRSSTKFDRSVRLANDPTRAVPKLGDRLLRPKSAHNGERRAGEADRKKYSTSCLKVPKQTSRPWLGRSGNLLYHRLNSKQIRARVRVHVRQILFDYFRSNPNRLKLLASIPETRVRSEHVHHFCR